jgi:predicted NACHT family NTPase
MENLTSTLEVNHHNLMVNIDKLHVTNFTHKWVEAKKVVRVEKDKKRELIKRKNNNSLLLNMLDMVFEETSEFPLNNAQFYKDGIEILLKQWDSNYEIAADKVYKKLSLQKKQDLLSYIALKTFTCGDYFFTQQAVEQYIAEYIGNLPNAAIEPQQLQLNSEVVLQSIETQHGVLVQQSPGIYAFSDLSLHEYFAAREIVNSSNPQALEQSLQSLVSHLNETRWREVFLLAVGMLRNADHLLNAIKHKVDALVAKDEILLHFLNWNYQKSLAVIAPYKSSAFRALGLEFILNLDFDFALALDNDFAYDIGLNTAHLHAYTQELKKCKFSKHQRQLLKQYYNANKLLVDCLNHAHYVSRSVRAEIEDTVLVAPTIAPV